MSGKITDCFSGISAQRIGRSRREKKKMIALCSRLECTGCGACANRCPHGSITMLEDTEGFSQPMINAENCTKCGACLRVCPVLNPVSLHSPTEEVYAAWALDDSLRRTSSSGGMYSVLAEEILKHGGAVVGSTFDSDFILRVRLADNQTDVAKLRGSKYVQNEPGKIYQEIEEVLKQKRPVLFYPVSSSRAQGFSGERVPGALYLRSGLPRRSIPQNVQRIFKTYTS